MFLVLAAFHDEFVRRLVLRTGLESLRRLAPGRDGVLASATTLALALAATHGVIDRVHDHAAHMRTAAEPAGATGFAERNVFVLDVADLADGGVALGENLADFTGGQADLGVTGIDRHDRRAATGSAADLGAASGNDFDV